MWCVFCCVCGVCGLCFVCCEFVVLLPVGEFAFNVEITIKEILKNANDASVRYFLEVDLNYPVHLHDDHRDFPFAPTK